MSSLSRRFSTVVSPSARAASSSTRLERDLDPGRRTVPSMVAIGARSSEAAVVVFFCGREKKKKEVEVEVEIRERKSSRQELIETFSLFQTLFFLTCARHGRRDDQGTTTDSSAPLLERGGEGSSSACGRRRRRRRDSGGGE